MKRREYYKILTLSLLVIFPLIGGCSEFETAMENVVMQRRIEEAEEFKELDELEKECCHKKGRLDLEKLNKGERDNWYLIRRKKLAIRKGLPLKLIDKSDVDKEEADRKAAEAKRKAAIAESRKTAKDRARWKAIWKAEQEANRRAVERHEAQKRAAEEEAKRKKEAEDQYPSFLPSTKVLPMEPMVPMDRLQRLERSEPMERYELIEPMEPMERYEPIEPAKPSSLDELDEANKLLEGINDPGNRIKAVELDQINVNPVPRNFDLPQVPSTSPASPASPDTGVSNFDSGSFAF